jgi:hypothetical protein
MHHKLYVGQEATPQQPEIRLGSIASVEQGPRQVGFTPDSGRIAATQRNDAMGQKGILPLPRFQEMD